MFYQKNSAIREQIFPITLAGIIAFGLFMLLGGMLRTVNILHVGQPIAVVLRWQDILFGMTIYLKTSVDFALFIGNVIRHNPGYKSRIAVEIGTALGNALGTILILIFWIIFKELKIVLAVMIFIASMVLLRLAEKGLEYAGSNSSGTTLYRISLRLKNILKWINHITSPILKCIIPKISFRESSGLAFWPLFVYAFTVPFILGLDDFAGYVPLFSIVNVYGFATGVVIGHMLLNILLYLSPSRTIKAVSNPVVSFLGSIVFVGLAVWGFEEVVRILVG